MMITVWQVAPALRMGNAVVVKPSEYTPLSVIALVETINEALPGGLLTVVSGGRDFGEALASHPGIGKVMFTGLQSGPCTIHRAGPAQAVATWKTSSNYSTKSEHRFK